MFHINLLEFYNMKCIPSVTYRCCCLSSLLSGGTSGTMGVWRCWLTTKGQFTNQLTRFIDPWNFSVIL